MNIQKNKQQNLNNNNNNLPNNRNLLQSNGFDDGLIYKGAHLDPHNYHNYNLRDSKDIEYLRKMAMFRFGITNT